MYYYCLFHKSVPVSPKKTQICKKFDLNLLINTKKPEKKKNSKPT